MRPTFLEVDGLLSYKSPQEIDFSTIDFAAIVGENGAGKSSLLDCMMFALFGSVYGNNMDWILTTGVEEGFAALEFDFDGHSWRVSRTRTRNKKTVAQLSRLSEDETWEVIADGSVRAVDLEIERLLRVDEAAFRSTVMLAQNEASAFSSATPAERKEILGKIVGLDRYRRLSETARSQASSVKSEANTTRALIEQLDRSLEHEEVLEVELGEVIAELENTEAQKNRYEKLAQEADLGRAEKEQAIENLSNAINMRKESLESQAAASERAYQEALSAYEKAEKAISSLKSDIISLSRGIENIPILEKRVANASKKVSNLGEGIDALISTGQKEADSSKVLASEYATLLAQYKAASERLDALAGDHSGNDGECWVCGTHLDPDKQTALVKEAQDKKDSLTDLCDFKKEQLNKQESLVDSLRSQLRAKRQEKQEAEATLQTLSASLASLNEQRNKIASKEALLEELKLAAADANENLDEKESSRISVDDDPQLQTAIKKLEEAEAALAELPGGASLRAHAATAATRARSLISQKAVLGSKLESIASKKLEKADLVATLIKQEQEEKKFNLLREAFGRNGIPALIYAGVVEELNEHINDILGYLSDGQLSVELTTTKETKKGTLSETLEVMIVAADGTRPYVSFSGGEKFRIDIAIRLGLSRLLANRHGAKLEFLAIDEGWGALDPQGIAAMISELNKLRSEFSLILTVTHIDAIREGFGTLIHVTKTSGGSQIEIE